MLQSSGRHLVLAGALACAVAPSPGAAQDDGSQVTALRGEVADLKATVDLLRSEIAAMKRERDGGQGDVAEQARVAPSGRSTSTGDVAQAGAGAASEAGPARAATPVQAEGAAARLGVTASPVPSRETVADRITGASRPGNQSPPNDPALKGFIRIPGSETAVRIGGFAKVDLIYDPRFVGDRDEFAVPSIPFTNRQGHRSDLSARGTRFSLELRRPSVLGNLRFYVENDFYGDGTSYDFHLNHAYGQVGNTYGGYGYSALVDADALPDTLDNWGPGGSIFLRTASVRQAIKLARHTHLTLSIEQPDADLTLGPDQYGAETMPDIVLVGRYEGSKGHLQLGGVLRRIGYRTDGGGPRDNVMGFALSASGSFSLDNANSLSAGALWGKGAAHYVNDISGLGLDAAFRPDGTLRPVGHAGGFGAFTHKWSSEFRSNLVASILGLRDGGLLPADAFSQSRYGAINLIWSPVPSFSVGIEGLYGRLELQDGRARNASRIQASIKYDFIR